MASVLQLQEVECCNQGRQISASPYPWLQLQAGLFSGRFGTRFPSNPYGERRYTKDCYRVAQNSVHFSWTGKLKAFFCIVYTSFCYQNVQKYMAKNIYEMQKKQITAGTCINNAKFQGTAALPHAARGCSSMVIPLGQCPVQGILDVCSWIWYQKLPESLEKNYIYTKNTRTSSRCRKKGKKLGHCSTAPFNQGQFHNGFSMLIPLAALSSRICLHLVPKVAREWGKKNKVNHWIKKCYFSHLLAKLICPELWPILALLAIIVHIILGHPINS